MCDGGLSRYVLDLLKGLDRQAFSVDLVCTHFPGPYYAQAAALVDSIQVLRYNRSLLTKAVDLWRCMRALKPDVVHTHQEPLAMPVALLAGISVRIETVHLSHYWEGDGPLLLRKLYRACATHHVVYTQAEGQKITAKTRREKIHVVAPGLEPERLRSDASRSQLLPPHWASSPVVGTIARFEVQKGILHFVEACRLIAQRNPESKFLLVGDGSLRPQVEALIDRYGLRERVHLTGFEPNGTRYLAAMDIFVLSSLFESWGFTAAEAMLAGKATIATDIEGPRSFIETGKTGLLVPPAQPEPLAQAVLELLEDGQRRQQLALAGQAHIAEHYTLSRFASQLQALYREVSPS